MLPLLINPLPIFLTLMTSFGVLFHDTQVDHATSKALAVPATVLNVNSSELLRPNDPHVHTEQINANNIQLSGTDQPRTQTRRDKDKEYISVKKYVSDGMGSEYSWPSI